MHVTIRSAGKLYVYNKAGVVTGEVRERERERSKTSSQLSVEIVNYHDFAFVVYKKKGDAVQVLGTDCMCTRRVDNLGVHWSC